jgi:uncharacterized protein YcfL
MTGRSALLTVAVAVLLLTAGCQTTQNASTPTATTTAGTETLETPTPTTEETTTTTTQEPAFNATVSFPDCHTVHVKADAYRWVGIVHTEGVVESPGNYSGATTWEVNGSVESVLVYGMESGRVRVENPALGACTEPEPTTTEATTTTVETTTATPTPTSTPTPTTTTVPTTTQTPTTTTTTTTTEEREPLREFKIRRHIINESVEAGYTKFRVTNGHEDAVSLNYDVVWYSDRDIMENVDRHELVLESGESVVLESSYGGNGSAYEVEYSVSELEYTEGDDG